MNKIYVKVRKIQLFANKGVIKDNIVWILFNSFFSYISKAEHVKPQTIAFSPNLSQLSTNIFSVFYA